MLITSGSSLPSRPDNGGSLSCFRTRRRCQFSRNAAPAIVGIVDRGDRWMALLATSGRAIPIMKRYSALALFALIPLIAESLGNAKGRSKNSWIEQRNYEELLRCLLDFECFGMSNVLREIPLMSFGAVAARTLGRIFGLFESQRSPSLPVGSAYSRRLQ